MIKPRKLLFVPAFAVGIIILFIATRPEPKVATQDIEPASRLVEVQALELSDSAPKILAFGRVSPKTSLQAVAEVSGRIIYKHPDLERGRFINQGTLLLEIDPSEYELKLAQAQANLRASETQLTRIDQEERNYAATLALEKQRLKLSQGELARKNQLKQKNLISSSELELEKISYLGQQKLVQDLENLIKLLPDDRLVTKAQVNVDQAKVDDAQRELSKTKFVLPFDARIAEVSVEQDQVVNMQLVMFEAQRMDTMVIDAQLSLPDLRRLIESYTAIPRDGEFPELSKLNMQAKVILRSADISFEWPAKVTRLSDTVNPDQATIGLFLEVKQDVKTVEVGSNPPLSNGMFLEAHIEGGASPRFVIPERALREGKIYVMTKDKTLDIKPVVALYRSSEGVAIAGDIQPGEQLILSDLIPAVVGMRVHSLSDEG
ncbi:biotin/lipoyl-binding protein [Alginatibacterium sediminis]|uniref:Biotin/lipoyl-binding protein n=1 Tax=Alginatibacterium sediminis TaxID=2164068 RepID=A0A420E8V4_9ALTE|nr:biotin/lipoyl-binding protein [Alginatibacterium sediminis]RKF15704.1 biotin/lipoyl-binding protein [Alginatibacterium sediminis]